MSSVTAASGTVASTPWKISPYPESGTTVPGSSSKSTGVSAARGTSAGSEKVSVLMVSSTSGSITGCSGGDSLGIFVGGSIDCALVASIDIWSDSSSVGGMEA